MVHCSAEVVLDLEEADGKDDSEILILHHDVPNQHLEIEVVVMDLGLVSKWYLSDLVAKLEKACC